MPSLVKVISLSGPFDALLNPGFFRRIGNVHEFPADGGAIGAAQDRQHLADGGVVQAEHVIDEDLAVVIGLDEAVGRRMQLLVILLRVDAERIEIGVQMAAHAIGADHHDRADGIAGGALQFGWRNLGLAVRGGLALDLVGQRLLVDRPLAVQRRHQLALRRDRPVRCASRRRPWRWPRPRRRSSFRPAKNSRHSASTDAGLAS